MGVIFVYTGFSDRRWGGPLEAGELHEMTLEILHGDCLDVMATLPDNSIDSIVTDPPYGLGFMGKAWDALPPGGAWAEECLRVLKPGGHLLAFGGTRTWHRLAVAVEDAGFEIRDSIAWMYGSGFPKSLDVSKAIDKVKDWALVGKLSAEIKRARAEAGMSLKDVGLAVQAATEGQYGGWYWRGGHMFFETGRNLPSRPEWEHLREVLPIRPEFADVYAEAEREVVGVRKGAMAGWAMDGTTKFADRDITAPATPAAEQWQGWGTALKPAFEPVVVGRKPLAAGTVAANVLAHGTGALNIDASRIGAAEGGRWPANVILDEHAADLLDGQSGTGKSSAKGSTGGKRASGIYAQDEYTLAMERTERPAYGDSGGASRFFYVAKAPKSERPVVDGVAHETVKPLALMRYLVKLVTPPGGTVLEPFAGSGTTVEACMLEGFGVIAIEREAKYLPLIQTRIDRVSDAIK